MNDEITNIDLVEDEFEALKERATMMGVKFHPTISMEKLKAKVDAHLKGEGVQEEQEQPVKIQPKNDRKLASLNAAKELVRVRVTCMDQSKSNLTGTIITTGNSSTGTIRKYVAFDKEWHIPRLIYNAMKEAKTQIFTTRKDSKGNEITESKLVNTYSIEVLPPLTEAELKDLAQRQAMANGTI